MTPTHFASHFIGLSEHARKSGTRQSSRRSYRSLGTKRNLTRSRPILVQLPQLLQDGTPFVQIEWLLKNP